VVGGLPKADGTRIGPLRNLSALPTKEGAAPANVVLVEGIAFEGDSTFEVSPKAPSVDASAPLASSSARRAIEIRPIFFRFEKVFRKAIKNSNFCW
jgi:hypothetical protein